MATSTAPDYLRLPVTWSPSRQFPNGQASEYQLALRDGDMATVRTEAGKGWAMTIIRRGGREVIDRGLFVTVCDALMVVYAEYYPQLLRPSTDADPVSPR